MQEIGCSAPNNNKAAPGPAVNSQHAFACAPRMSDLRGVEAASTHPLDLLDTL